MTKTLEYKGYHAKPEYSAEDGCFIGHLLFIDDIVSFEGNSEDEVCRAFQDAVDEYLEFCAENGKQPEKEYTGNTNIRISPEQHQLAARNARKRGQTLNQFIKDAVAAWNLQAEQAQTKSVVAEERVMSYGSRSRDAEILRQAAEIIEKYYK